MTKNSLNEIGIIAIIIGILFLVSVWLMGIYLLFSIYWIFGIIATGISSFGLGIMWLCFKTFKNIDKILK